MSNDRNVRRQRVEQTARSTGIPTPEEIERAQHQALKWQELIERTFGPDLIRALVAQLPKADEVIRRFDAALVELKPRLARLVEAAGRALERGARDIIRFVEQLETANRTLYPQCARRGWLLLVTHTDYPLIANLLTYTQHNVVDNFDSAIEAHVRTILPDVIFTTCRNWPHREEIISQALRAHLRREFAVSIPTLLAQADGISREMLRRFGLNNNVGLFDKPKKGDTLAGPAQGSRHLAALATAGALLKDGWREDSVRAVIAAVSRNAASEDLDDHAKRVSTVASTAERLRTGRSVTGWGELTKVLDRRVAETAKRWSKSLPRDVAVQLLDVPRASNDDDLGSSLSEVAVDVNRRLNDRASREQKQAVSGIIVDWLVKHDRLLFDSGSPEGQAYLIDDNGAAIAITNDSKPMRKALSRAGVNATEPMFSWLVSDLEAQAPERGRAVAIARWTCRRGETLYVSSGPTALVRASLGAPLEVLPNGTDDILFAHDSSFPSWSAVEPRDPFATVAALRPCLHSPEEVDEYSSDIQLALLEAYPIGLVMGVRPLPILTCIGQKGSGKSTLMRAITELLLGIGGGLATVPMRPNDVSAIASSCPLYAIDNLDQEPQPWLLDMLATASTGGTAIERQLYTNGGVFRRGLTAAIGITTRTATFAARPDITERVLPLMFSTLEDQSRLSDGAMTAELGEARNGVLSWLVIRAIETMESPIANGYPGRFQEFAWLVESAARRRGLDGSTVLRTLLCAQQLAVADLPPLVEAIVVFASDSPLVGRPSDIIQELERRGAQVRTLGGAKAIASRLREHQTHLRQLGFEVSTSRDAHHKSVTFDIRRAGRPADVAENAGVLTQPFRSV